MQNCPSCRSSGVPVTAVLSMKKHGGKKSEINRLGLFSMPKCVVCKAKTRKHCSVCQQSVCANCRSVGYSAVVCLCLPVVGYSRVCAGRSVCLSVCLPCGMCGRYGNSEHPSIYITWLLLAVSVDPQKSNQDLSGFVNPVVIDTSGTPGSIMPQKAGWCVGVMGGD